MTTRSVRLAAAALILGASQAVAQTLAARVTQAHDGTVQLRYASRPGSCGDGESFVHFGIGRSGHETYSNGGDYRPCEPGPVRLVVSVYGGRIERLREYVGPDRGPRADADLGVVSTGDAARFLTPLIEGEDGSVARQAVEALVLADSVDPWPTLLRVARASGTSRRVERSAAFWLGQGATEKLGLGDVEENGADDEVRAQAVFALSQQPRETAVPELLTVARESHHPIARARALFWLGQSGDTRALDLFATILGVH